MLTQEEIKNLLAIVSRPSTTIQANEAIALALLQQKLQSLLTKDKKTTATPKDVRSTKVHKGE